VTHDESQEPLLEPRSPRGPADGARPAGPPAPRRADARGRGDGGARWPLRAPAM